MYSAHVQWYAPCSLVTQRQWAAHRETEKCYADSESWRALFRARIWSGLRTWNHSHTVDRPTRRHEDGRTDGNTPHAGSHHCGGAMDGSATRSTLAACKADTSLAISTGHIMCQRQESGKHLDAGRYVRHGWYRLTTQCQISWPTSMAALSGIPGHPVLEWSLTALQAAPSESQNGSGARTTMSPSMLRCLRRCNVLWG